ncbi:MAG: radical SAM protein [Chloroflexota bacterium]
MVGRHGSGTIFFTNCNLHCVYCQNYTISQLGYGERVSAHELARMMLSLQGRRCHNINLVSPTHVVPQVLEALELAAGSGLSLPLVYNTGGYDSVETLRLLDGVVDIYMPDMKYADAAVAQKLSDAPEYPSVNRGAVREMHRQAGDLHIDQDGIGQRGLLVRHLVLPEGLAGTKETATFLSGHISINTYFNVMDQYRPCYRAREFGALGRRTSHEEFKQAIRRTREAGLTRLDGMSA